MKRKTFLLAMFVMLLWGSLYPMVKFGYSAYNIVTTPDILLFLGIRFTVCGGVICLMSLTKDPGSYRAAGKNIGGVLLIGLLAIIMHYTLNYVGMMFTDSSKTALIKQVGTLFYICCSFLFIKDDRPSVPKTVAAVLGFLGIVALNFSKGGISFAFGDVLILGASFCTMLSNVTGKKVFAKVPTMTATGISQLFGGTVMLIVGIVLGGKVDFRPDWSLWVIVYTCTASVVSYCVWNSIVKTGELSRLFIIKFAEPVFACLISAALLGENIWKLQYLAAFILIFSGILIANRKKKTA